MMVTDSLIKAFQTKILLWYTKQKRDLPWRKTTDPYRILLSEVMLQQTQVDRVIGYYERFLLTYPTMDALAKADTKTLLSLWSGLGYNNRALRLRACAQELCKHSSVPRAFPSTEEELCALPGIGPYTARAVLSFAFNKEVPVIDTNIRRVLIHELGLAEEISKSDLESVARSCVPKGKSCIWHNALMDYGALVLTAKKTGIAPLSKQSTFAGSTRQVRGAILRHLLAKEKESFAVLKKQYAHSKFDAIIEKLLKETLVVKEGRNIYLSK